MVWTRFLSYPISSGPLVKGDADPQVSLKDFVEALAKADAEVKKLNADTPDESARVFVSPLFTFQGTPAFDFESMATIVQGVADASKRFKGMLIVPGSILWKLPNKAEVQAAKKDFKDYPFAKPASLALDEPTTFNTTPAICDGKVIHVIHWRFESGPLTLDDPASFFGVKGTAWSQDEFWKRWKDKVKVVDASGKIVPPAVANVFEWGDELVGIEPWSDHTDGCLKKEGKKTVGLQVVLGYGAEVVPASVAIDAPGALVSVDGSKPDKKWQLEHGLAIVRASKDVDASGKPSTTYHPPLADKKALYSDAGKVAAGPLVICEWHIAVGGAKSHVDLLKGKPLSTLIEDPEPPKDDSKQVIQYVRLNDAGKHYDSFHDFLVAHYPEFAKRPERERECKELWDTLIKILEDQDRELAKKLLTELFPKYGLKPLDRKVAKVFWSGERGKQMAKDLADNFEEVEALESSDIGKLLDSLNEGIFSDAGSRAGLLWDITSDYFARGTTGDKRNTDDALGYVHVYMEHGLTKNSVFFDKELPQMRELQKKGVIRDIIVHVLDKKTGDWLPEFSIDSKHLKLMCDKYRAKDVEIHEEGKQKTRKIWVPHKFYKPFDVGNLRRVLDKLRDTRKDFPGRGGLEGITVLPRFCLVNGVFANPKREMGGTVVNIFDYESPKEKRIFFPQMSVGEVFETLAFVDDYLVHEMTFLANVPDEVRYIDDALVYAVGKGPQQVQAIRKVTDEKAKDLYAEVMVASQLKYGNKMPEWADPKWRRENGVITEATPATLDTNVDPDKIPPPPPPPYVAPKVDIPFKIDKSWKPKVWASDLPYEKDLVKTILKRDEKYKRGVTEEALEQLIAMPAKSTNEAMSEARGKIATLRELLEPPAGK